MVHHCSTALFEAIQDVAYAKRDFAIGTPALHITSIKAVHRSLVSETIEYVATVLRDLSHGRGDGEESSPPLSRTPP